MDTFHAVGFYNSIASHKILGGLQKSLFRKPLTIKKSTNSLTFSRRRIQNSVKHISWSILRKQLAAFGR